MFGFGKRRKADFWPPAKNETERSEALRSKRWNSALIDSGLGIYLDYLHPIQMLHDTARALVMHRVISGNWSSPSDTMAEMARFRLGLIDSAISDMPTVLLSDLPSLNEAGANIDTGGKWQLLGRAREYIEQAKQAGTEVGYSPSIIKFNKALIEHVSPMRASEVALFRETVRVVGLLDLEHEGDLSPLAEDLLPSIRKHRASILGLHNLANP